MAVEHAPVADRELMPVTPPAVTTGPLGPNDRLATDEELANDLDALLTLTQLTVDDIVAGDHARTLLAAHDAHPTTYTINSAHEYFGQVFRGSTGQTAAQYLARALGQVGTTEHPPGSNRTTYNTWFASLYGHAFEACAWCAIFQCWCGIPGAIAPSDRSAGAWALAGRFPDRGRVSGTLIAYGGAAFPDGHIEALVKNDGADYAFTVGGNTSDNGLHTDGVWYVHRYLPGNIEHLGMPDYHKAVVVHDHLEKSGKLAITGVLGSYTINHTKRRLNHVHTTKKPLVINGHLYRRTVRALQTHLKMVKAHRDGVFNALTVKRLQAHLHVKVDGDLGPVTIKQWQRRLNEGTF